MNEQEIKSDKLNAPRFEFRTFGHDFTACHEIMAKLSVPVPEDLRVRIFDEIYIISKTVDDINIKVKNNKLDVKKLIHTKNNLEKWNTIIKKDFPDSKQMLIDEIFPAFNANIPIIDTDELDKNRFLNIVKRHTDLFAVSVHKRRYAYIVNLTICEFAEIIIGNDYIYSVSIESTDAKEVIKTVSELKLDSFENINYLQAIKRVNNIVPKPLAN